MALEPDLIAFAHDLAGRAGEIIRPLFRAAPEVTDKGAAGVSARGHGRAGFDPVTEADRGAEAAMRAMIRARFPGHGVIGEEEGTERADAEFVWVLDPVDGTREFVRGGLAWGTLIALAQSGRPVLGVLDQPVTGERWTGTPDGTVFAGWGSEAPARTRPCAALSEAVLTTTHPDGYFSAAEAAGFAALSRTVRMTRFGGDCYGYGLLALGTCDLVVESGLREWDVAALAPIITGAGGRFTDWRGNPAPRSGQVIAAGDARVHAAALAILRPFADRGVPGRPAQPGQIAQT